MKKIILSFIVLCVSVMAFGMVALAAPDADPTNGNLPKGHQCAHDECHHFFVTDDESAGDFPVSGWEYNIDDYLESVNPMEIEGGYALVQFDGGKPQIGKIYYWSEEDGDGKWYLCSNSEPEEEDKEEKSEDSHSSSDDSKPAGPTENQLKQDSIYSSVDSQIKSIVESVANSDSQNSGRVTIDGEDLINSLPKRVMSKMAENPSIELFFNYTCNGMKYTTVIPAGASIDPTIEWFGPVYLMTHYPTLWHQNNGTSVPVMAPVN